MELEKKVMERLKEAMKSKDDAALRALRAIKAAILTAKTEKGAGEMDEAKESQLVMKLAKQRKESIEIFEKQGRADLAQTEREELEVLNTFLPKQMTEEELTPLIQKIISDLGVTDAKEMGKVMGAANKEFAEKADGGTISKIVKQLLAS
jgi:uncharacterized protein YqeY